MIGDLDRPMLALGLPPDGFSWVVLILGAGLVLFQLLAHPRLRERLTLTDKRWLLALAPAAVLASWAYFHIYLHGIPRIIDATSYLLEARTIASGGFTFEVLEPTASFRGRFLLHHPADPTRLGVIFPPGYPVLLSLGVLLNAVDWVGPALAAALVLLTFELARYLTDNRTIGLLAALFSLLSATLRYHTADTMSHGWAALLATTVVYGACRVGSARTSDSPRPTCMSLLAWACLAGTAAGLLIATRQLTGAVFAAAGAFFFVRAKRFGGRALFAYALCALPGCLLLLAHQKALTGSAWLSPQFEYYRLSDGPPGCFGVGLGKGCHYEHGDVVSRHGGGLDLYWAVKNTLHRLHWFSLDVANFEPLALLVPPWLWLNRRRPEAQPLLAVAALLPLAYALFYFQGSYPGGGARFFVALLPVSHVALAAMLYRYRAVPAGLGLCLIGFAVHGTFSHQALAAGVDHELAAIIHDEHRPALRGTAHSQPRFVDFDHRFNLLFEPGRRGEQAERWVARDTRDDRKRLLIASTSAGVRPQPQPYAFESEHDWPVLQIQDAWVQPVHLADDCVSGGRALAVRASNATARVTLEATGVPAGRYEVVVRMWSPGAGCTERPLGARRLPARLNVTLSELEIRRGGQSEPALVYIDQLRVWPAASPTSMPPDGDL